MAVVRVEIRVAEGLSKLLRLDDVHYGLLYHVRRVAGTRAYESLQFRPFRRRNGESIVFAGAGIDRERLEFQRGERTPLDRSLVRDSILEVNVDALSPPVAGALQRVFVLLKPKTDAHFDGTMRAVLCVDQPSGPEFVCESGGPEPCLIWAAPEGRELPGLPRVAYTGDLTEYIAALEGRLSAVAYPPVPLSADAFTPPPALPLPKAVPARPLAPRNPDPAPPAVPVWARSTAAVQAKPTARRLRMVIGALGLLLLATLVALAIVVSGNATMDASTQQEIDRIRSDAYAEREQLVAEAGAARDAATRAQGEARDAATARNTAIEEKNAAEANVRNAQAEKAVAETAAREAVAAKAAAEATASGAVDARLLAEETADRAAEDKRAAEAARDVAENVTRLMLAERDAAVALQRSAETAAAQAEAARSTAVQERDTARADERKALQQLREVEMASPAIAAPSTGFGAVIADTDTGSRRGRSMASHELPPVSPVQVTSLDQMLQAARLRDLERFGELRQRLKANAQLGTIREDPARSAFSDRVEAGIRAAFASGDVGALPAMEAEIERFLAADDSYWNAYAQLALTQAQGSRTAGERAQANAQRALIRNPASGDAFFAWGIAAALRGDENLADGAFCALLIVGHTELTRRFFQDIQQSDVITMVTARAAARRAVGICSPSARRAIGRN